MTKALIIAYYEALDEEVMELLGEHNIKSYTKWTKVEGCGEASGPHMLNTIWPKGNNVILCVLEESLIAPLVDALKKIRGEHLAEGLKVFQIPIDILT